MGIMREATKIISSIEMRIRRSKKLPFSKKYVLRLIRGDKRAKIVLNKEAMQVLFPHVDHVDLLAKQNASILLGVIADVASLKQGVVKRLPKAANDDQYGQDEKKKAA